MCACVCVHVHVYTKGPFLLMEYILSCPLHLALVVVSFYQPVQVLHLHTWWWSLPATCTGGVFPSAIGANTPCTGGGATHCNLRWWSFSFHPLVHILHLRSNNLHCVVVYIYLSIRWLPDRAFLYRLFLNAKAKLQIGVYNSSGPQKLLWSPIFGHGHGDMHFTWLNVVNLT